MRLETRLVAYSRKNSVIYPELMAVAFLKVPKLEKANFLGRSQRATYIPHKLLLFY